MNELVTQVGTAFDAIDAGTQRIAMFVTTFAEIRDWKSWFNAIVDAALEKGFVVTLFHDADMKLGTAVRVFIGKDEDIWRVPALIAVRETGFIEGRWSPNAQARENALLGMSAARSRRMPRPTATEVVYTVLDRAQLERVRSYGGRSFGTPDEAAPVTILRDAPARLRRGEVLARVEVRSVAALLGRRRAMTFTRALIAKLHAAIVDRVQIRTTRGWR